MAEDLTALDVPALEALHEQLGGQLRALMDRQHAVGIELQSRRPRGRVTPPMPGEREGQLRASTKEESEAIERIRQQWLDDGKPIEHFSDLFATEPTHRRRIRTLHMRMGLGEPFGPDDPPPADAAVAFVPGAVQPETREG